MAENTKSSVMAIMTEVSEGVPVVPAAATDYVALQEGWSLEPSFEVLENAELRSSIGRAKPLTGIENPSAQLQHYLRHSGTEGQAPNYGKLLKAAFGSETVAGSQYDTVSSSTTSVIKVDTGEGANFDRGHALLIKDGSNGYSIRPVKSVSGDNLTLGFNLANAPSSGVNLGKAIKYSPANSAHPTLSLWEYLGNGGAIQAVAGCRVTSLSIEVEAGQMINASYSLEGIRYYFNPIEITASTRYLDFLDDSETRAAAIPAKIYRDPHELAQALEDAMNSLGSGNTFTVTYSDSTGKFTLSSNGTTFQLLHDSGSNSANKIGGKIGFVTSSDDTGSTSYTSDNAQSWAAAHSPSYDNSDPLVAKDNEVLLGSADNYETMSASSISFNMNLTKSNIPSISAGSGVSGSVISAREVTIEVTALLNRHDADKFRRFRENEETSFLFNFGVKSGGNWIAGKCGCLYIPTATISSFTRQDVAGFVALNITLNAFVDSSGNGEVYLNFV